MLAGCPSQELLYMIYKYIGRHQMNRRSYLCLYVYDNSKEFKIGIAGFSIYGTKSEKLRFYLGSSSRNFSAPQTQNAAKGPGRMPQKLLLEPNSKTYFVSVSRVQCYLDWRHFERLAVFPPSFGEIFVVTIILLFFVPNVHDAITEISKNLEIFLIKII